MEYQPLKVTTNEKVNAHAVRPIYNSAAYELGLKLCDVSADMYIYGMWCHGIIISNYVPYTKSDSQIKCNKVNAYCVAWIYGNVPVGSIEYANAVYDHLSVTGKKADKWLKYYVQSLTDNDYGKLIDDTSRYSVIAAMSNFRKHPALVDSVIDLFQFGRVDNPMQLINYALSHRSKLVTNQIKILQAMKKSYR